MAGGANLVDLLGYEFYQWTFTAALCCLPYVWTWCTLAVVCFFAVLRALFYVWETWCCERVSGERRAVFITGCDSGFGFLFAQRCEALGFTVFAGCLSEKSQGARHLRATSSKRLHVVECDVTRDKSVTNALTYVKRNLPSEGLWAIINNAGINMIGEMELAPVFLYQRGLNVNFYGMVRVIRESLPLLRKSQGRVINISSIFGRLCMPRWTIYAVTKHAVETMSDSLRLEMAKFGVKVSIVEPGAYAHATSVYDENVVKRIKKEMDEMWDNTQEQARKAYKKEQLTSTLAKPRGSWPPDDYAARHVISAVEHALCSETPRQRYFVFGPISQMFRPIHVTALFFHIMPTWLMDKYFLSIPGLYALNIYFYTMAGGANLADLLGYEFYQWTFTAALCCLPYVWTWCTLAVVCFFAVLRALFYVWETWCCERVSGERRAVFITGCDSGFGFMFAQRCEALGFTVFAGCLGEKSQGAQHLRATSSKRLHVVECDVTRDKSVTNALTYVKRNLPSEGLWAIINNAGVNMFGEVEIAPVFMYERGLNVNLYGMVRIIRESLPLLRKSQGRVINISSVHGRFSMPRQAIYEVTKHAVETMSDSLRLEMAKFGVKVSIVEPGLFSHATSIYNENMVKRIKKEMDEMWDNTQEQARKAYKKEQLTSSLAKPKGSWPPDDYAARHVISAVEHALCSETPRHRYLVIGPMSQIFRPMHVTALFYQIIPTWLMDKYITWWSTPK